MKENIAIVECNFNNRFHCDALVMLMNEYITDKMGDGTPYLQEQKVALVEGLKKHPSKLILFAMADDRYVGLITCFINFATFTVKPFINIHDIIVTNDWRNKGIGRKLLEAVIDRAKLMDCSKVTLEVREDNTNAMHLYSSLGFGDTDPRQYYWAKYL
jgi:ribosomal protein S18 acetylase RimI-like enzyme